MSTNTRTLVASAVLFFCAAGSFAGVTPIPIETSVVRRPELSGSAPPKHGPLGLVEAMAINWVWVDGAVSEGSYLNCITNSTGYADTYAGFQIDTNTQHPKVGEVYYLRNLLNVVGNPCVGGIDAWMEMSLPAFTYPSVTPQTPIVCWRNANDGSGWINSSTTSGYNCPTGLSQGVYDTYSLGTRGIASYFTFYIAVPVFSTKTLAGIGDNNAVFRVTLNSGISGFRQATQWAGVYSNPSTIEYPVPSATLIADTSATLNATLWSHYTSGTVVFDYGTTAAYGITTAAQSIADTYDGWNISQDLTGLTPGTTYYWRMRYLSASGNVTGAGQSFATTGSVVVIPKTPGDFQADGKGDLMWRNASSGANSAWLMNGTAVAASGGLPSVFDPNFKIVGIGDFQGDGKADILWRNSVTGANVVWLMNGMTVAVSAVLPSVADPTWTVAGIGDFQGDGKADILWRNTASGSNSIWFMNGTTVATSAALPPVADTNFKVAAIGDFQGDGKADILWRNATSGANSVWLMDGASVAVSAGLPSVFDPNFTIVGSGDFQGDGKTDVLWRNTSTGSNVIWFMNGPAVAVSAVLPPVADTTWTVARVVDLQGDGKADIVWRNTSSGANAEWLMNGGSIAVSAALPTVTDINFQVATTK